MTQSLDDSKRFSEAKEDAFRAAIQAYIDRMVAHAEHARAERKLELENTILKEIYERDRVAHALMFRMTSRRKGIHTG